MEENESHIKHSLSMSDIASYFFSWHQWKIPPQMCVIRLFPSLELNLQSRCKNSPPLLRWMENSQIQAAIKQSFKAYETSFTRWNIRAHRSVTQVTSTWVPLPVTATIPWKNKEELQTNWLVLHLMLPQLPTPTGDILHKFYEKLLSTVLPCQQQSRTTQHP